MPIVGHQEDTDQGHHRIGLPRIVDGSPNLLKAYLFAEITAQKNEQWHVEEIDNGISSQHHAMRISIRLRKMTDRNEHDQEKFQSVKHFVSLCRHFVNWQVNNNFQSPSNLLLIYNTEHRKEEAPNLQPCKSTQIFLLPEGKEGGNSATKKSPINKGVSIPLFAGHGLFAEHRLFYIKRFPSSGRRRERGCLSA